MTAAKLRDMATKNGISLAIDELTPYELAYCRLTISNAWQLDIRGHRSMESGAFLLSNILWPGVRFEEKRREGESFIYASMIALKASDEPMWGMREQLLRPSLLRFGVSKSRLRRKEMKRLWSTRMEAAWMALQLFTKAEGEEPKLPPGLKLTIESLSERAARRMKLSDAAEAKKRVWGASRPVIHMCVAAMLLVEETARGETPDADDLLRRFSNPADLKFLTIASEFYVRLLERFPKALPNSPAPLLRFSLVERPG